MSERIIQSSSPYGPGIQRPHSYWTHSSLLTNPGNNPLHRHWLLEQRRLHVQSRGPNIKRLSRKRWYWDQVTLFAGLDLLWTRGKYVRVTRNSFGGFLPLTKRCLEENIRWLSRFMRYIKGRAVEWHRTLFSWCFKRDQLEDIRGDWVVLGLELGCLLDRYEMKVGGRCWYCMVLYVPVIMWRHVFIVDTCSNPLMDPRPLILLRELHRSHSPRSLQWITDELPLQVCVQNKMVKTFFFIKSYFLSVMISYVKHTKRTNSFSSWLKPSDQYTGKSLFCININKYFLIKEVYMWRCPGKGFCDPAAWQQCRDIPFLTEAHPSNQS